MVRFPGRGVKRDIGRGGSGYSNVISNIVMVGDFFKECIVRGEIWVMV